VGTGRDGEARGAPLDDAERRATEIAGYRQ